MQQILRKSKHLCHLLVLHFEFIRRLEEEDLGAIKMMTNTQTNCQTQRCNFLNQLTRGMYMLQRYSFVCLQQNKIFRLQPEVENKAF